MYGIIISLSQGKLISLLISLRKASFAKFVRGFQSIAILREQFFF